MVRAILISFIFTAIQAIAQQKAPEKVFFDNGKVQLQRGFDELDRLHGPWLEFFEDGTPKVIGLYEHGKRQGKWITMEKPPWLYDQDEMFAPDPNGPQDTAFVAHYKNDFLDGEYLKYWHNVVEIRGNYKNGRKEGEWEKYSCGSYGDEVECRLDEKILYSNGLKDSAILESTAWGIATGDYENGQRTGVWLYYSDYTEDGKKDTSKLVTYKNDQLDGPFTFVSGYNNEIKTEGVFIKGIVNGSLKKYRNDKLMLTVEMDEGIPNGWLINKEYGSSLDSIFFVNGIADGKAVHYYEKDDSLIKMDELWLKEGMPLRYRDNRGGNFQFQFQKDYAYRKQMWVDTILRNRSQLVVYEYSQVEKKQLSKKLDSEIIWFPTTLDEVWLTKPLMRENGTYFFGTRKILVSETKNEFGQIVRRKLEKEANDEYEDYGLSDNNTTYFSSISEKLQQFEFEEIYQDYENGQPFIIGDTIDGQRHGKWQVYFENGEIAIEAEYNKGDKHGLWKYYDVNGNILKAIYHTFDDPDDDYNIYMLETQPNGAVLVSVSSFPNQDDYSVPPLVSTSTGDVQMVYQPNGQIKKQFSQYSDYSTDLIDINTVDFIWKSSKNGSKWTFKSKSGKAKIELAQNEVDLAAAEKEMIRLYLKENEKKDTFETIYSYGYEDINPKTDPSFKKIMYNGKYKTEQYYNDDSTLMYTLDFYNEALRTVAVEDGFLYKGVDYTSNEGDYYYTPMTHYRSIPLDSIGQPHGELHILTSEGQEWKVASFEHGKLHGDYVRYSAISSGDTIEFRQYYQGYLHGQSRTYYSSNGQVEEVANYKKGKLHGLHQRFLKNGIVAEEGNYKDGDKAGIWVSRDIFGRIISEVDFDKHEVSSNLEVVLPTQIGGEKIVSRNGRYVLYARGELWDIEQRKVLKTEIKNELMKGQYNHYGGYEGMFSKYKNYAVLSNTGKYFASGNKYSDLSNGDIVELKGQLAYFGKRDDFLITVNRQEPSEKRKADEFGSVKTDGCVLIYRYAISDTLAQDSLLLDYDSYMGVSVSEDEQALYVLKKSELAIYSLKDFKFQRSIQLPITLKNESLWEIAYDQLVLTDVEMSYVYTTAYTVNGIYQIDIQSGKVNEHHLFNRVMFDFAEHDFGISAGPKGELFSSIRFGVDGKKAWNSYYTPEEQKWDLLHEKNKQFGRDFGGNGIMFNDRGNIIANGDWSDLIQYLPKKNKLDTIQPGFFGHTIGDGTIINDTLQLFCNSIAENEPYKFIKVDLTQGRMIDVFHYPGPHNRFAGFVQDSAAKRLHEKMIASMSEKDTTLMRSWYSNNRLFVDHFDIERYNYSQDGKILFDHNLFVNTEKKEPIEQFVKFVITSSNEIIFYTPDNYYMGSSGIRDGLYFSRDFNTYPFEQFDLKYNRPDIILDRLGYADSALVSAYHQAYQKRLKKMGFTEEMLEDDFHLPEIEIENFEEMPSLHDQGSINLKLKLQDSKYKLDRINVWVNDVAIYGTNGISLRDKNVQEYTTNLEVFLAKGNNKVQVSVLNQAGAESYKETFEVECTIGKTQPDLYLITIGESEFQQTDFNLTYAAKDAKDMAALFEKSKVYATVHTKTLVNDQVTKANVKALKSFLQKADINDEVMVFIAGHGVLDANLDYYFATYDMDFQQPQEKGLAYEDVEGLLDGIKPLKKTLLIDACHSGEIDKEEVELAEADVKEEGDIQFRVVGKTATPKLGTQNTSELTKSLFTDLRKGTGATVISSAGGMEFAMEGDDWNNGLFTYCFIKGIQSKAADLNKDGEIWLSEIQQYVSQQVYELSGGRQQPTSRIENQTIDFRVW